MSAYDNKPLDEALLDDLTYYSRYLLRRSYGGRVDLTTVEYDPDNVPRVDAFNAAVNFVRTTKGLEPTQQIKSGIESLADKLKRGR